MEESDFIKVITQEGKTFILKKDFTKISKLIADNFENNPHEEIKIDTPSPIF